MIPRRASLLLSLLVALPAAVAAIAHCGARVIDAVDLLDAAAVSTGADSGTPIEADAGTGTGSDADAGTVLIWPTPTNSTNSDPWIVAHHDSITQMQPRVLVLDYYNPWSLQQAQQLAQSRIDAIAEGSRYHGYMNMNPPAPAFLKYALLNVIDLTDQPAPPPDAQRKASKLLPTDANGAYSMGLLFTQTFAADPANPTLLLTPCQLFERGIINELWLMTGDEGTPRRPPVLVESKQVYDGQNSPIAGMFESRTGYDVWPASVHCQVTARVAYLSPVNDVGCDLVSHSVGIENTHYAIPYLGVNASHFFNQDFTARFRTTFNRWADLWCATSSTTCITYASQTVAQGTYMDGGAWKMDPFVQGCGTAHFPPNARSQWDYTNPQSVQSRCEHYAMRDGPDASDRPDLYALTKENASAPPSGDGCAGGWQIYLRQSMPGLNNAAYTADGGSPMKNWWPFLFY